MGKTRNKNRNRNRQNPVGIPSVREVMEQEEEIEDGGNSTFIQTILEQVKSHTVEERDSGLNSLASICSNAPMLDELLKQHDIIKTISPLLLDKSIIIRHSSAGALRNISSTGAEVCDFMVSQGIMVHLVQLFKQYFSGDWEPHKPGNKNTEEAGATKFDKIDTLTDTFIQSTNLLWNLCENSETALKAFARNNLGLSVSKCLNVEKYGTSVAIAAAQCLNTITEENSTSSPHLGEIDGFLQQILTTELSPTAEGFNNGIYLQTLCAGILLNLHRGDVLKLSSNNLALLLKILSLVLSIDHISQLKKFSSEVPTNSSVNGMDTEEGKVHTGEDIDPKSLQLLEQSSEQVVNLLNSQLLALETLSNILFIDEEEADVTDDEDDSGESIVECMEEDSSHHDCDKSSSPSGVISEVFEGVIAHGLVDKSLVKAYYPPVNVLQIITESAFSTRIPEILLQLRCRALICYQNLVAGLDLKHLGGFPQMKLTWDFLGQLLVEASDAKTKGNIMDQVEATTSAMRALVQKWVDDNCSDLLDSLTPDIFKGFCNIYQHVDITKIQANVIKIIGGLGTLIVRRKGKPEGADALLFLVGEFLLDCICKNTDRQHLWRAAEALDTLFDVFSEDDYNEVLNQLKMVEKLKVFLPQFKKTIKLQRRDLGENKAIIDTARLNLSRFIDYKMKNGCH